jgi:hypothetical protein
MKNAVSASSQKLMHTHTHTHIQAFLDHIIDAGVLGTVDGCTIQPNGSFDCA